MPMGQQQDQVVTAPGLTLFQQVREARRVAQPAAGAESATDAVYRAISIFPSMLLARLRVSPNQITAGWILLACCGVVALASADQAFRVAGAVLLQVSYLLDFVDGEVARLQARTSRLGCFLDLAGHGVVKNAMFLAIGYRLFVASQRAEILLLAFSASVAISVGHTLPFYARRELQGGQASMGARLRSAGLSRRIITLLELAVLVFESPGLYAAITLAAIVNRLEWVVVFYGLAAPLWFLYRVRKYGHE